MENSTGAGLFTRRVVLLKDSDCVRLDGKILMPTTIDMAKIKKPSTGQYNKNVQFSKSMSEELVRQTLQDAFPLFNLTGRFYCASYGHKSTAFNLHGNPGVWGGNMINKTVRGNSVLYILLEDDQMPQESPHVTNGTAPSSAPVASENVNQPTLSNTSGIVMSQNNLQPWSDNLLHGCTSFLPGPSATSKNVDMMKPQNIAGTVSFQGLNQSTYASDNTSRTITTQYDIPPCSGFQVQESSIPHLGSSAASTNFNVTTSQEITATVALPNLMNQSTLSDASATIMAQRDWQPSNDFPMQEVDQFLPGPSAACANVDMITSQTIAAAADGDPDFTTLMDLWPEEMPGLFDNDETGTSDISNIQPPNQGILLNSLESFDCPADDDGSTSGVCDHNSSSDDLSTHEDEHFNFSVEPNKVPLKGAGCCRFESDRALPENVQSGFASFENLETVEVYRLMDKFLIGMKIPPAQKPGWVKIFLKKADGKALGKTVILYYDEELEALEVVVQSPRLQAHLFRKWADSLENHNTATSNGGEAQNFGICGCTQPVQMLCVLVYTAAEIGGQRFIEMIFNSSAGRVVYDLYKDRSALPEAIARECGHEKTAIYFEEITKRFSKESDAPNYPQTIDWSELVRAAEEAQKQLGLSSEEKSNHLESNVVKDTGYVGDIDTSSNESCESVSSESEDNIPLATSKEMDYLVDELSENALVHEDRKFVIKKAAAGQSLMFGHFNREQVTSRVSNKVMLPTLKGRKLSLFQDSFLLEAHDLKHLKGLKKCDTSFFFASEAEGIQSHLITDYERWFFLFNWIKDSSLHNQTFAVECGQFVQQIKQETQAVMMGASSGCVEEIPCIQSTRELLTTSDNPELAVQWNTTQGSTKHSTSNVWVLTCLYRPARNILFVYVADNSDVFPHKAYFDDDGYELSTQRWQWQRYSGSLFNIQSRLQELRKLSEQMRPEFGPTPLPTCSAKQILPQVQGKHVLRQPECCPTWLYTMVRQCLVYAPEERQPLIAIFDAISSRTLGAHLISTWLSQYNQLISSPLNKCQSEDPCLVNDETNNFFETLYEEHREDLAKDASLTAFTLTIDSKRGYLDKDWRRNIRDELAKSASSTAFTLTINGEEKDLDRDRGRGLEEGLANSTSLTAFTLTINSEHGYLYGDWERGLGEELAKSRSLTAFTLAINIEYGYIGNDWGIRLGKELAKSTSLTALTLTIHIKRGDLCKDWGRGLGEGLANSTSLTAFTLTINSGHGDFDGDWVRRLGEGLAKSASLTAFTLTINSERLYQLGNWGRGLGEGLANSTSLTAFTLTINSKRPYLEGDWGRGLGEGLANSTSLTAFTLTVNSEHLFLDGEWGRGVGEGLANSTSLTAFNFTINSKHGDLSGDCGRGLGEGLAKSTSLTAFTLTINSEHGYLRGNCGRGLGEGLAKSTSLTAFTFTINSEHGYLRGDCGRGLVEGLAKSTSLTAFTFTFNSEREYLDEDWGRVLGEGLAKSKSLTSFTLTINSEHGYQYGDWGRGLGEGLANSTSLTAFTLSINSEYGDPKRDWGRGLVGGLANSTSLTAFTLTINSERLYLDGDWGRDLGEALVNNTSLTAFTITINSKSQYLDGDWGRGLGEGLANNKSLTAFTFTINSKHGYLHGDWGRGLGEGLAKSTSLTAFTFTINSEREYLHGDSGRGLGEGLAKSTSLTAFTLTINSKRKYLDGDWGRGLGEGLAKSTSITAFTLTISSKCGYLVGDWARGLGEGLANSTSLTAFTLTINSEHRYLRGDWARGLGEGLANSTSLTAFTLTINSEHGYLYGDWGRGLGNGLANSTSITAFTLTINSKPRYLYGDWVKGLVEGLVESTSITALILTTINNDDLTGNFVESLGRVFQSSKLLVYSNVRISDSSPPGGCFSSFDVDSGFEGSPPLCQWNRQINHEEESLDSGYLSFSEYSTKLTERKMKKYDAKKERTPKECTKKYDDEIFVGKKKDAQVVLNPYSTNRIDA